MFSTPACSLDGTATATVSNGTAPYTYNWSWGNNQTSNTTTASTSNTVTGLAGGNVYVQVVDNNGNQGWGFTNATPPFTLTTPTVSDTCSAGVGEATVTVNGGTPPFAYAWSNGATSQSVTGLTAGQYDVTVTDANGCRYAASDADSGGVWVFDWSPIQVQTTTTPSSCNDGTATATPSNGTAPYTYYWYNPFNTNFPVQTTQTATNLPVGSIVVRVTDASGCQTERWVWIQQGVPPFTVNTTKTPETCQQANGSISTTVTGSSGPYTYAWSNGATTSNVSGLSTGTYGVTVTDVNGCPVTKTIHVQQVSPITLALAPTNPSCQQTNGSVTATPGNGTPPYTYQWSNGATSQTASNLGPGYYSVVVTDANGCDAYDWVYIQYPASCYGTISGTVYQDNANNCMPVAANPPMPNQIVTNGVSWTMTNTSGQYSFQELPGTYTITNGAPLYHNQTCPAAPGTHTAVLAGAGAVSAGNDFYHAPLIPVHDLRVSMFCGVARPGFNETVQLRVFNDGTVPMTPTLTFTHDAAVNYVNANPIASNYVSTSQTATWNLNTIPAGGSQLVTVWLGVPATTVLGTTLNHTASVAPSVNDSTPLNNTQTCGRIVTGSFDPNDKAVLPEGLIDTNQLLQYTIRFQNTGTDTAFTVMISDTLSPNLDITTFQEGVASHDYDLTLHGNGIMQWRFDNILLPDSNTNEPASHGQVTFYIKPKTTLSGGDKIFNTAAIYFDFNAPIITNTVENEIDGPVGVGPVLEDKGIGLYPNPSRGFAVVTFALDHTEEINVSVLNLHGQKVYDTGLLQMDAGEQQVRFSTAGEGFSEGIYLVKVSIGNSTHVKRLVVTQ